MNGPPRSLQGRLFAWVLAVVVAVWLAAAAITWLDARHELDELLDGHLAQAAALLVAQQAHGIAGEGAAGPGGEGEGEGEGIHAPALHRYAPKVMFQVFHEGRLALRSANAPPAPMLAAAGAFHAGFASADIDGQRWRVFAAYGAERDVQVYVAEQGSSRLAIMWAVLRGALWPLLAALPLLALAAWWAVRRGVAPMRRLGRAIGQRQPQSLEPIALTGITSEMAPLVEALNRLFARTAGLLESERRFTADAAHELRTPIAAIRAQAQVARAEADAALRRRALDATIEGCDRAARVVEQLLTLARVEAGAAPAMCELDLCALGRSLVGDMAARAIGKGQSLEFVGGGACTVRANETLLAILLRNVLDNALRYSPPSSRVRLSVRCGAGAATVQIEDDGPGMDEDGIARLGERFFRQAGEGASGSGLGWSIARRIAAVHGFPLGAGRAAGLGGLSVRLEAPCACDNSAPPIEARR